MNLDVPMSAALAQMTLTVRVTGRHRARARIWVGSRVLRLGAAIIGTKVGIDQGPIPIGTPHTHESCVKTHEKASPTRD